MADDLNLTTINETIVVVQGYPTDFGFQANLTSSSSLDMNVSYYLSEDPMLDTSTDVLVSSKMVNISSGNVGYGQQLNLDGFSPKNYLILSINGNRAVAETNYSNNLVFSKLSFENPRPDIAVAQFITNDATKQVQGNPVRLITRAENLGNVKLNAKYKIYLSLDSAKYDPTNPVFSVNDLSFTYPNNSNIASYFDYNLTQNLLGEVYFIMVCDQAGEYAEQDEKNNIAFTKFTFVKEDFEIAADSVTLRSSYISAGASFPYTIHYHNQGTTTAKFGSAPLKINSYISTDALLELGKDSLISSIITNIPPAGSTGYSYPLTASIPSQFISSSEVYLITVINPDNTLSMDDKSNNIAFTKVTLKAPIADVLISPYFETHNTKAFFLKESASLSFIQSVQNKGTKSVQVEVDYFLSKDSILDSQDSLLLRKDIGIINSNTAFQYTTISLFTKFAYPYGKYFIIIHENPRDLYEDKSAHNDVTIIPLYYIKDLKPELTFENTSVSSKIAHRGDMIQFMYIIYREAGFPAVPQGSTYSTRLYLSFDKNRDASDILVGEYLGPGQVYNEFAVPQDWPIDSLYLLIILNEDRTIEENVYFNNIAAHLITLNDKVTEINDSKISTSASVHVNDQVLDIKLAGNVHCEILNIQGNTIAAKQIQQTGFIDMQYLPSGTYFFRAHSENYTFLKKIFKD